MPSKLTARLIVLALLAALLLFGVALLHSIHPATWHVLTMGPDVISNSH